MPTIPVENDALLYEYTSDPWATTRDLATTTKSPEVDSQETIENNAVSGRGSTAYNIGRFYLNFDTSSITGTLASATLKIYGATTHDTLDLIVLKSDKTSGAIGSGDFGSITGGSTPLNNSDGSGGGTLAGSSTIYSDNESDSTGQISTWSLTGYNDIKLTSSALSSIKAADNVGMVIIGYDYDYLDIAPSGNNRSGLHTDAYTGTDRDPYIDYTLEPTATENSIFFGTNF